MSEQGAAFGLFLIMCIICGPFYLSVLAYGIIKRKQLAGSPIAKLVYIVSLPLALLFVGLIHVWGTDRINTSSDIGNTLANAAFLSLLLGLAAATYILFATLRAKRGAKT